MKILAHDSFTPKDESRLYGINMTGKLEHVFVIHPREAEPAIKKHLNLSVITRF